MRINHRAVALLICLIGAPALLHAQSINIDLGDPNAALPGAGYRAAGLPGHWVKIDALDSGDYPLVGLDGNPVVATVHQIGGTEIQDVTLGQSGDPTGDDAIFMKDALITHTPIENCLFFDDLQPGMYEVLTYAWMPSQSDVLNKVRVDFNPTVNIVGGAWTGEHVEGVTFARHIVEVTNGFLGNHSGVPDGGDFSIGAAMNGVQIRRLVPEPPLFATRTDLQWLGSLNALRYDVVQGDLALLHGSSGDFSVAAQSCLANNTSLTSTSFGADPASGEGQWFLVRGVISGGNATYDSPGSSQQGSRDFGIASSGVACP